MVKKFMNKRGWIRIVEAFLAVLIIIGAAFVIMSRQTSTPDISENVYEVQTKILDIISRDDNLRSEILSGKNDAVNSEIKKMISPSWNFTTSICNINDICAGNIPTEKNIFTKEILISSNLTKYSVKKLKFSVWMK